jgi:murein DD-endopeptidase MepM/ murein hydrolase activator NlpD
MAIISPIETSANNIVKIGLRSSNSLPRARNEFNQFLNFLDVRKIELEKTKLPEERKIKELSNIDLVSTFGSAGGLLSSLLGGGLDLAGLVRGMFSEKGKKVGGPSPTRPQKPKVSGNKLKIGGLRAIGITNAIFAGLDFATGLQEGESVGKAAAGAGGSLAGSLLGGAIGQALIPIPGVGFVLGSMAGGFLGGWTGDRVYESVSGEGGGSSTEERTGERLKEQEERQKKAIRKGDGGFEEILMKFSNTVDKFERFALGAARSIAGSIGAESEVPLEYGPPMEDIQGTEGTGEFQEMTAEGGKLPSNSTITSGYGWRWGRQHWGTDYGEPPGTPISVIQPGVVEQASYDDAGGWFVRINHPDGSHTRYLHLLEKPNVSTGQVIEPGTVIGKVGSTGRSTGPHLHFEYAPPGRGSIDSAPYADKYFRFGGNVRAKPKESSSQRIEQQNLVQKPNQPIQTQSQQQTSPQVKPQQQSSSISTASPTTQRFQPQTQIAQSPQSVMAASPRQVPQIQSYPSYSQGQSYIIERPIMMMSNTPSVNPSGSNIAMVPTSNGGSSSSGPNMGQIVNSLVKSMLLTNLSSS